MKLNKKELEEIKTETNERKAYRAKLVNQYDSFYKDIKALERVYEMRGEYDKLERKGYSGLCIKDDEKKEVLSKYEELSQLDENEWWILNEINYNYNKDISPLYSDTFKFLEGTRTLWDENAVKILTDCLIKLGYTFLEFGVSGSIATENIHYIIKNSTFRLEDTYIDKNINWGKPVLVFYNDLEKQKIQKKEIEEQIAKNKEQ